MKNIDSKLNAICSKYKEIEENLLQQNNLDRNILVRLNKEYAELKPLVEKITIYKQCIKNIKDLEELKNDTDVHIRNEADKELSGQWAGKTYIKIMRPEPPPGKKWVLGRLTRIQKTTRPDSVWPELWTSFSPKEKKKETTTEKTQDERATIKGSYLAKCGSRHVLPQVSGGSFFELFSASIFDRFGGRLFDPFGAHFRNIFRRSIVDISFEPIF